MQDPQFPGSRPTQEALRAARPPALSAAYPQYPDMPEMRTLSGAIRTLNVAAYGRCSTDQQETSIEDQLRSCREEAHRRGLEVRPDLIFTDEAVTGAGKCTHKRDQYQALREAIRAGKVDILICDQLCRLARDAAEALSFFEELNRQGTLLFTADGFDSEHPTAKLMYGVKSVFSEFFLDETRHRVRRGMVGEFERGAMVTAIPYGYEIDLVRSAQEGKCLWAVNEKEADVVRDIFCRRREGMSLNQITAMLNALRVPTPRRTDEGDAPYWRAAGIWRLLQNPIYKGVYQVNFGRGKREMRQPHLRLVTELALVSAQDWDACQSQGKTQSGSPVGRPPKGAYGGGKHVLAGVLQCGVCGVALSCHHAKADGGSLYCIQCAHATTAGVPGRQPSYVSVKGVRVMLRWLLEKIVRGEALERYRDELRSRLEGGPRAELAAARQSLTRAERSRERLARLLGQINEDDPVLEQQYANARTDVLHWAGQVQALEDGLRRHNEDEIRQQLDVDLSAVVDAFLSDSAAPERARAILRRVFPRIVLVAKPHRYVANFEVQVKPGAILAEASGTPALHDGNEVLHVRLTTSGSKSPTWTVEEIDWREDAADEGLGQ